ADNGRGRLARAARWRDSFRYWPARRRDSRFAIGRMWPGHGSGRPARLGVASAAGGVFAGTRNVDSGGARFPFGECEGALRLVQGGLIIRGIDLDKNLSGFDCLIVVHLNFRDAAVNFRGDRRDVAVNLGVDGAFTVVEVEV